MLTRKHFLKSLLAVAALSSFTAVNAQTTGKTLVVYYSWSGNTRAMAQAIAKELQADIYEIKPIKPYPESYRATVNQARDELQRGFRPEIEKNVLDLSQYSTIVLGSPNWWSHLSMPVVACQAAKTIFVLNSPKRMSERGLQPTAPLFLLKISALG